MILSQTQLLIDLHTAYLTARKNKRSRQYQVRFENNMDENLRILASELYSHSYEPGNSVCFVIEDPKKREIFAASFRDRIVHHLYYNYVHEIFERNFIADSYSCIKNRGTHYGIKRLECYIRRESLDYTERCFILKMDVTGYFMHINRNLLLSIVLRRLAKMRYHKVGKTRSETWNDLIDFDFVYYLSKTIILYNPAVNCSFRGKKKDWDSLPHSRSLFYSPEGCGLPIGNLTSQLFSNVYMGEFDDYMKRTLKVRSYGRYVDDFYVVSNDREYLLKLIPLIETFLSEQLNLTVNPNKTYICDSNRGVGFLGSYIKPRRRYIHNVTLRRIKSRISNYSSLLPAKQKQDIYASYCGLVSYFASLKTKLGILWSVEKAFNIDLFVE